MKKKNLALIGIFVLAVLLGCANLIPSGKGGAAEPAPEGALFNAGTYEAQAEGFGGAGNPVKLSVTMSDNSIESIEYTADGETPTVGGAALPQLVEKVLAAQSPNIDMISGATVTSTAFFTALNDCITQAGADPAALESKAVETVAEDIDTEADVVIAGAGGAGMTAAITAAQNGKKVIILERQQYPAETPVMRPAV